MNGDLICKDCGRTPYPGENYLNGLCSHCWEIKNSNNSSTTYIYKCPECKGEFNQPTKHVDVNFVDTDTYYSCPFCGKAMEGL